MLQGIKGVIENHSRTSIAHYLPHTFFHVWLIAMNRTLPACRLLFAELAMVKPLMGVVKQFGTAFAKCRIAFFMSAIQLYHCSDSLFLVLYPIHRITSLIDNL